MSKKLAEKQQRRLAEEKKREERHRIVRRRNLTTAGIALLVGAVVIALVIRDRQQQEETVSSVGVSAAAAQCDPVQETPNKDLTRNHVDVGTPVSYSTSPPVGGDHWPPEAVVDADFYTNPIEEESLVHNMEHSQIIFWYNPAAPETVREDLQTIIDNDGDAALVGVPFDAVPTGKNFVITAWGASQGCEKVSQKVVNDFRRAYQGNGPEPFVDPFDG